MEKLNCDCLLKIFSKVNLLERIRYENVCREWYTILQVKFNLKTQLIINNCLKKKIFSINMLTRIFVNLMSQNINFGICNKIFKRY